MKLRPTPVIAKYNELSRTNPKAAEEYLREISAGLVAHDGFQVVLHMLAQIEHAALTRLRSTRQSQSGVDRDLGRLEAINDARESLRALLPDAQAVPEPQEEEEWDLYPEEVPSLHSFDFDPPSGE